MSPIVVHAVAELSSNTGEQIFILSWIETVVHILLATDTNPLGPFSMTPLGLILALQDGLETAFSPLCQTLEARES